MYSYYSCDKSVMFIGKAAECVMGLNTITKVRDLSSEYVIISYGGNPLKLAITLVKMSAPRNSHVYQLEPNLSHSINIMTVVCKQPPGSVESFHYAFT